MALWGYAQGLIVGALSLAGFAGGRFHRLAPRAAAARRRARSRPTRRCSRWSERCWSAASWPRASSCSASGCATGWATRLGVLDGIGGAALVACLGLGLVWIGGAVALQTPGARELREPIQRSAILRELNEHLPPSGPILRAFARFDPFPQIEGPQADVRAPDSRDRPRPAGARGRAQRRQGARHRLRAGGAGQRLGRGRRVGGHERPRGGRPGRHDRADRRRGLAPRRRGDLVRRSQRPRAAARPGPGRHAGAAAARRTRRRAPPRRSSASPRTAPTTWRRRGSGSTSTVVSQDAYGHGPVRRAITALRGRVRQGNSGGPVVDGSGSGGRDDLRRDRLGRRPQRLRRARLGGRGRARQRARAGRYRPVR